MSDPICCVYCRQRIRRHDSIVSLWVHDWSGLNSCSSDGILRAKP